MVFLKFVGPRSCVRSSKMATAGLVEVSPTVQGLEPHAVINRLTDAGESFLRAFGKQPLPGKRPTLSLAEH